MCVCEGGGGGGIDEMWNADRNPIAAIVIVSKVSCFLFLRSATLLNSYKVFLTCYNAF